MLLLKFSPGNPLFLLKLEQSKILHLLEFDKGTLILAVMLFLGLDNLLYSLLGEGIENLGQRGCGN